MTQRGSSNQCKPCSSGWNRSWLATALYVGVIAVGLSYGVKFFKKAVLREMALPTTGFFARQARDLMEKFNTPGVYDALQRAELQHNDTLLEICIGHGFGIQEALQYPGVSVTGVDISEHSIAASRELNSAAILDKRLSLFLGSASSMPFLADKSFDKVFHFNCCYFWDDMEAALKEIRRVLKPGGTLISGTKFHQISPETHDLHTFPNQDEVAYQAAIVKAGFTLVRRQHLRLASGCTGLRPKSGCPVDSRMAYELTIASKPHIEPPSA